MAIRVGINGFGRIGRNVFRVVSEREDVEIVQVNDLSDAATLAHLLKYDSVFGRYDGTVESTEGALTIDGREVRVTSERSPADLAWGESDVDFVVESTGVFRTREAISAHLEAGASKVLLTVPPKDEIDAMIVRGVNDDDLEPGHRIISNASCTTNCLAPVAKVLHDEFGIQSGLMTTVHAYTNDQRMLDLVHSDLRRSRAAALNIIPTTTGAARAVGKVIPDLAGRIDGMAMRVPVPDGSVVDLTVNLGRDASVDEINGAMRDAAAGPLAGVLEYTDDPIVSSDIIGNPHSSIFDGGATAIINGSLAKVLSWYDNEWGYSNRVVDLLVRAHGLGT